VIELQGGSLLSANAAPPNDLVVFRSEPENHRSADNTEPWKILVVDDDEQVHKVTSLALSDVKILDAPLTFIHAYSAAEAKGVLERETNIAVILLDVVMEKDDSGLELARIIRTEMKLVAPRIILRTGQPGYAPELEVIQNYDINDYRMKSELTRTRLITALTTAVRSYQQVHTIQQGEGGMRQIIEATNAIFNSPDYETYCQDVLSQSASMLGLSQANGLLTMEMKALGGNGGRRSLFVSGASGIFNGHTNLYIDEIPDREIAEIINRTISEGKSIFEENRLALYIDSSEGLSGCLYMDVPRAPDELVRRVLDVFAVSIGIGFKNFGLIRQLNQYAYFDQLCSLPNRTRFLLDINSLDTRGERYFVAVLDVDHFSALNNALGHKNGDLLIQAIADRLANLPSLTEEYTLARIGGDTFGILGPERDLHPSQLLAPFERPFVIKETPFPVSATIGLARLEGRRFEGVDVLKNADMAMKIAKGSQDASYKYYSDEMADSAERRLEITRDLHPALSQDEFVIYYQPQIDIQNQRLSGVESLVRWVKKDGTIVPPSDFIPVAESTGLIIDIGKQIFRKSCKQAAEWKARGILDFKVAINVSVRQFLDADFITSLKQILREEEIKAEHFELEITESTLMSEVESVIPLLEELNNLGFDISIDDFGTGYSSLNYLLRLPIQRLKVDRSFVMNLEEDERARTISELIVSMANNLGLSTIAEGIETPGQLDFIRKLGCRDAQGYYYSRPIPIDEFDAWHEKFKTEGTP
jgi:diguanylate cyclase (GGDEF)-like protein